MAVIKISILICPDMNFFMKNMKNRYSDQEADPPWTLIRIHFFQMWIHVKMRWIRNACLKSKFLTPGNAGNDISIQWQSLHLCCKWTTVRIFGLEFWISGQGLSLWHVVCYLYYITMKTEYKWPQSFVIARKLITCW